MMFSKAGLPTRRELATPWIALFAYRTPGLPDALLKPEAREILQHDCHQLIRKVGYRL